MKKFRENFNTISAVILLVASFSIIIQWIFGIHYKQWTLTFVASYILFWMLIESIEETIRRNNKNL